MRVAVMTAAALAVVTVVVIVVIADRNKLLHPHIPADGKICKSVEVTGDARLLKEYASCVTIEGNLRIQLIEYNNKNDPLLGLPNLVQVTGYVIIYRLSYLQTLRHLLPRLAVIRGQELFHGYSLVIFGNIILQEVNLWNLTHVLAGAVRVEKNLCRGPPHRWELLSLSPSLNVIQDYGVCFYPMCEEQKNCDNVTSPLHTHCTTYGGCYQGPQCHSECAGGCYAPHDPQACVACRNYLDGDTCVPDCSASLTNKVHHLGYRCIREDECATEPWTRKTEMGSDGVEQVFCVRCNDNCYGKCHGTKVTTANLGRKLRNCRWLEGNLEIMVSGGRNLMQQLEDSLGQLELVTGYLKVYSSDTLFSLNFLSSLKVIGGEELVHGRYALYVLDNEKLQELWDLNHDNRSLSITKGKLFFQHNPSLCKELIRELAIKGGKNPDEDVHMSPAEDTGPCYKENLEVRVSPAERRLNVSWKYQFYGKDDRFVIGYYLYYREAPQDVTLYQGRDACNDNVVWEREFRKYERNKTYKVILDKLKPYTQYAVYVDVYYTDSIKNASRSSINYIRTTVSNPSPVRNLRVEPQKNSSTLNVLWLLPGVANGPLNIYEIKYARLKHTSPGSRYRDRDDVCDDVKYEQHREASHIEPAGGEEEDVETRCCNCSNSASRSMEDRMFDRQLDINFENYVWQSVLCKRVIVDDGNGSTTTPATSSASTAPTTATPLGPAAAAGPGEKHTRRRRLRSVSIPPTGTHSRLAVKIMDSEDENEVCKEVNETTSEGTTEECDKKTVTTSATRVTLTGLRHLTTYRVWVRPCHHEGRNCGDWSVLEVTTSANMSVYRIQNLKVKEVNVNETNQLPATVTPNNSNPRHSLPPKTATSLGTTLLVSWGPPPVPRGDSLAYIIRYQWEGGLEKKQCVLEDDARRNDYTLLLKGMKLRNFSLKIKLRTRNGDGPLTIFNDPVQEDNIYWIVFIPFLCIAMLGICIMEVALWLKRRRIAAETTHTRGYGELLLRQFLPLLEKSSIIDRDALKVDLDCELGKGNFGKVYRGKLTLSSGKEQLVAVKTHINATIRYKRRFLEEVVAMKGIQSNFVVRLIGIVNSYEPLYVVMELMDNGDLKSFLMNAAPLSDEKMRQMAVEAADGMAYLGSKKLVHRDLAARNCMLDKGLTLKIGDFGLARHVTKEYYIQKRKGDLPVRWMAPESLKVYRYSAKSDVWSYGVLLWELATGGLKPYEDFNNKEVIDYVLSQKTLSPPEDGPKILHHIMKECWDFCPKKRPTFKRIVKRLLPQTPERYQEYFQGVSFYSSSSCDSENPNDIDEGFNASGSSQEDVEAEHSCSSSSREQDINFSREDFDSQSNEDDIAVDDDLVCLTPAEPPERSSCTPLSCLTGQVGRLIPANDATNRTLLFRTPCLAET